MTELCPNYKYGIFILVPTAPGCQVEETISISSCFSARTTFLSIPDYGHRLTKRGMALWLRVHLIAGSRKPLELD